MAALSTIRSGVEDHLRAATMDGSFAIHTPGAQRIQPSSPAIPSSSPKSNNVNIIRSKGSAFAPVLSSKAQKNRFRTRTIEKNVVASVVARSFEDLNVEANVNERRVRLGALDSVLISPTRVANVRDVDSKRIAAILKEHSPLELQRHLITSTVHNQVNFYLFNRVGFHNLPSLASIAFKSFFRRPYKRDWTMLRKALKHSRKD